MPLQPNLIERFLIRRGILPGPLLDLSMSTFQFWAMIGAMELGLSEHLDEQPLDVESLAERTEASERGTVAILDQLAGVSGSTFGRGVASLLGLGLFLFSGGRNYEYETLKDWLSEAGFPHVSRQDTQQPGFSLVIARKQPAPRWTSNLWSFFGA